ncbi:hypothetical protein D3C84_1069940 [compost metagenome]
MVGYHTVVYVHREEDAGQRQNVSQYRCDGGAPIVTTIAPEGTEQPMPFGLRKCLTGALVSFGARLGQDGIAGILRFDFLLGQFDYLV